MPEVIETTVFQFAELDESAKEKARDWYRGLIETSEYSEHVYEDAERIADIIGITFERKGKGRSGPAIWFSGFSSQGDGACFEGSWSYAKGMSKAIRAYAPLDQDLHKIADALALAARRTFYKVSATAEHHGHYYHSGCMRVETYDIPDGCSVSDVEHDIRVALRDFADWIYAKLDEAHDWANDAEQVDENITANEYTFTASGERFG